MITMTMNPTIRAAALSGVAGLAAGVVFSAGPRFARTIAQRFRKQPKPFGVDARHIPHDHSGPVDAFVEGEFIKTYDSREAALADEELVAAAVERHAPVELHLPVAV